MPSIVTSRKRPRTPAQPAAARDRAIRTASIAIVAACAIVAAWRLLAPHGGGDNAAPGNQDDLAGHLAGGTTRPKAAQQPGRAAGEDAGVQKAPARLDAREPARGIEGDDALPQKAGRDDMATPKTGAEPATPQPVVLGNREREFFDNDVENTIASVSEPGAEFFGFPPMDTDMDDSEIIAILKRPVVIEEDDDEETVAAKERTAEFKAKALEAMENGLTFPQFIRDLVALRNEQAAMREDAYNETVKILRRDGEPAAREYMKAVNDELKAQGLKEIVLSPIILEDVRNGAKQ